MEKKFEDKSCGTIPLSNASVQLNLVFLKQNIFHNENNRFCGTGKIVIKRIPSVSITAEGDGESR